MAEFHFPALGPDHLQYFSCEKRKWINHLAQDAMTEFPSAWTHEYMRSGLSLQCFVDQMPRFLTARPPATSQVRNPDFKKASFAARGLGPTISDAADPPKRLLKKGKDKVIIPDAD